jgi:hypothetical protein
MSDMSDRGSRAAYYRKMAEEAEEAAARATYPESRDAFLKLAKDWRMLADAAERRIG